MSRDNTLHPVRIDADETVWPAGSDRAICLDARRRLELLSAEAALRAEAEEYARKAEALEKVRLLLDPIWEAHPDWTFAQVYAQAKVEHPEWFQEVAP